MDAAGGVAFIARKREKDFRAYRPALRHPAPNGKPWGRSEIWVWSQLRRNKTLDFGKIAETLQSLQVPLRFSSKKPSTLLPLATRRGCSSTSAKVAGGPAFLVSVEERSRRLLCHPVVAANPPRRRREIEALEEKRHLEREAAKAELEILAGELLAAAESSAAAGRGVARGLLGDRARLLLVWGAAQRSTGLADDNASACILAYRLAESAGDTKAIGLFYLAGSRLLSDLHQHGQALRFAQAAGCIFQRERRSRYLARALVEASVALAGLEQLRESRIEAIAALRLADRTDWQTRSFAWARLADLALSRGDCRRALALFGRAKKSARADCSRKPPSNGGNRSSWTAWAG